MLGRWPDGRMKFCKKLKHQRVMNQGKMKEACAFGGFAGLWGCNKCAKELEGVRVRDRNIHG